MGQLGEEPKRRVSLTHNVPKEVVANVLSNVSTVEFSELAEPNYRGAIGSSGK
jgi:hypothetical protein